MRATHWQRRTAGLVLALSTALMGPAQAQLNPPNFPPPPQQPGQPPVAPPVQPVPMPQPPQPVPQQPVPQMPQPQMPMPPMPMPQQPVPQPPMPPMQPPMPQPMPPQMPQPQMPQPQMPPQQPMPPMAPPQMPAQPFPGQPQQPQQQPIQDPTGQRGVQILLEAQQAIVRALAAGQRVGQSSATPSGWQRERAQGVPEVSIDRPADWTAQLIAIRTQTGVSSAQASLASQDGRHMLVGRTDLMQPSNRSARLVAEQAAAPHAHLGFVREITRQDWQDAGPGGFSAYDVSFTAYEMRDYIIVSTAIVMTVPQLEAMGLHSASISNKLLIGPKILFSASAPAIYVPMLSSATW